MPAARHRGHHDVLAHILFIRKNRALRAFPERYRRARMRDARGQAQQNGRIVPLGKLEGELHKIPAFLRVGRLEQRHVRAARVKARILLVLREEHERVVRHDGDKPGVHARIRRRKERIGRDVQSDVLHARHRPRAADGRAIGHFHGHLLVRGPFAVNFRIFRNGFGNLRRRGAGIARADLHARFPRAARHGLVAKIKRFFHLQSPRIAKIQ